MKRYIIMIVITALMISGCQTNNQKEDKSSQETSAIENVDETANDSNDIVELEPLTLDMLVDSVEDLSDDERTTLSTLIDKINLLESNYSESVESQLDDLYYELDETLISYGYDLDSDDTTNPVSIDEQDADDLGFSSWTLKSFLGFEYTKLSKDQVVLAENKLKLINEAEANYSEETAEVVAATYTDMYDLLKTFGLKVPVTTLEDFVEAHLDRFSQTQKSELIKLDNQYNDLMSTDPESSMLEELDNQMAAILSEAGFNADDVFGQLESGSIEYARYTYDGIDITYVGDRSKERPEDTEKYEMMIQKALKIISPEMKKYIEKFVIDTDGKDNILAYVLQENDDLTRWRMVLDIKDAFDEEGRYIEEYDETIVHEFAHILTLNASQMQDTSNGTYENEEGILGDQSLINQFYQEFWLSIKDDFDEIVDPNDPDSAYDFYDQYTDHFVSDYAATNPEEDIAETFRVFVYSEKPEGNKIKDKKIQWMYKNPQLKELRNMIRRNLAL